MRTLTLLMTCGLSLACSARAIAAEPPATAMKAAAPAPAAVPPPAAAAPATPPSARLDVVLWGGADEAEAQRWVTTGERLGRLGDVYSQFDDDVRRVKRPDGTYAVVLGACPADRKDLPGTVAFLRHFHPQVRLEPASAATARLHCPVAHVPDGAKWRTVERDGRRLVFLSYLVPYALDSGWPATPDTGAMTYGLVLVDTDGRVQTAQFKSYAQARESPAAGVEACQLQVDEEPELVRINATCKARKWECAERRYFARERATLWFDGKDVYQATEVLESKVSKRCEYPG